MNTEKYRKVATDDHGPGSREVMDWGNGITFMCPCDNLRCYIASPPHTITFDSGGVLTLEPSIGYRARQDLNRPQHWCHFYIRDGHPEMCDDSQCPGAGMER